MDSKDVVIIIAAIIGGGGIVGGIIALLKFKPEAGQILVTTAQGVVIVQGAVIENLTKEITRLADDMKNLRDQCEKREADLLQRITELEAAA